MGPSPAPAGARTRPHHNPEPIQLTGLRLPATEASRAARARLRPERLAAGALLLAAPSSALLAAAPAVADSGASAASQTTEPAFTPALSLTGGAPLAASLTERSSAVSKVTMHTEQVASLDGRPVTVRGQLKPNQAGARIVLQGRDGKKWTDLATTRTHARGHFRFRFTPKNGGHEALRVRFTGNDSGAPTTRKAGTLNVFSQALVSWYYDAGGTACGFHAYYGVANVSLPCGTKVAFRSGSRTVVATVDDRGPYVGGREYDLNQNTAHALGFGGVGDVWTSVQ